jgi:hypothetical protein
MLSISAMGVERQGSNDLRCVTGFGACSKKPMQEIAMQSNSQVSMQSHFVGSRQNKPAPIGTAEIKKTDAGAKSEQTFVVRPEAASHMYYK